MEEFQIELTMMGGSGVGLMPLPGAEQIHVEVWTGISLAGSDTPTHKQDGSDILIEEMPEPDLLLPDADMVDDWTLTSAGEDTTQTVEQPGDVLFPETVSDQDDPLQPNYNSNEPPRDVPEIPPQEDQEGDIVIVGRRLSDNYFAGQVLWDSTNEWAGTSSLTAMIEGPGDDGVPAFIDYHFQIEGLVSNRGTRFRNEDAGGGMGADDAGTEAGLVACSAELREIA